MATFREAMRQKVFRDYNNSLKQLREQQNKIQQQPQEEEGGFFDSVENLLGNQLNIAKGTGGLVLETAGNFINQLRPDNPNHLMNWVLGTTSENLQKGGDWLREDIENVKRDDSNALTSTVSNFQSALTHGLEGLSSGIHSDKSAEKFESAQKNLENPTPLKPAELSFDYIFDRNGLPRNVAEMLGFMAPDLAAMALVPGGTGVKVARTLGGDALIKGILGAGTNAVRRNVAKTVAKGLPGAATYAVTSAPYESFVEGGFARKDARNAGKSEEEANRIGLETTLANMPLLLAANFGEGALLGMPFLRGVGKISPKSAALQAVGRTGLTGLQEGTTEALQGAISDWAQGKDYAINPFNWNDQQLREFKDAFAAAAALGIGGNAYHAFTPVSEDIQNYRNGSNENLSNQDYAQRYSNVKATNDYYDSKIQSRFDNYRTSDENLVGWARDISGGNESTINKVIEAAKRHGIDPKLLLSLANAESNIGANAGTSEAGAIGVMQLMPETAESLGVNPNNEDENIEGGAKYLKQMLDRFGGDQVKAVAAYNAGPGAVENYGGVPPYGETQNYVKRIFSTLDNSPEYSGGNQQQEQRTGNIYTGENGKAEGKYWQRQHDGVSFDGAQPELLNAVDMLSKWYFEKTGKPLYVTAGTNGSHPSNGSEHGHDAGWKVDINDSPDGQNVDGFLLGENGGKGTLTDEFIAYGRSLGLGMNWEGDHIDVALDGNQWDGNGENAGGFNPSRNVSTSQNISPTLPTDTTETNENLNNEVETQSTPIDYSDVDAETQKMLDEFVFGKQENSTEEEKNFFDNILDDNGKVNVTEENLNALAKKYGEEITSQEFWKNLNKPAEIKPPQQQQQTQPAQAENYQIPIERKNLDALKQRQDYFAETKNTRLLSQAIQLENSDTNTIQKFLRENPLPADFIERWNKENADENSYNGEEVSATPTENKNLAVNRKPKQELPQKVWDIAKAEIDDNNSAKRKQQFDAFSKIAEAYKIKFDSDLSRLAAKGYKKPLNQIRQQLMNEGLLQNENPSTSAINKSREYTQRRKELDNLVRETRQFLSGNNDTLARRKALQKVTSLMDDVEKLRNEMLELNGKDREYRQKIRTERTQRKMLDDYDNEISEMNEELSALQRRTANARKLGNEPLRKKLVARMKNLQEQIDGRTSERGKFQNSPEYLQDLRNEYEEIVGNDKKSAKRRDALQKQIQQLEESLGISQKPVEVQQPQPEIKTEPSAQVQQETSQPVEETPQQEKPVENPVQEVSQQVEQQPQEVSQPVAENQIPPQALSQPNTEFEQTQQNTKQILSDYWAGQNQQPQPKAEEKPTSRKSYHFDGSQTPQSSEDFIDNYNEYTPQESQPQEISQSQEVQQEVKEQKTAPKNPKTADEFLQAIPAIHEKLKTDSHPNLKSFVDKQAKILRENPNDEDAKGELKQILSQNFNDEDLQSFEQQAKENISEVEETPQEEKSESAPKKPESKIKSRTAGNSEKTNTDANSKVDIRYKVAEMDDVIPSHVWTDDGLNEKNPDYPHEEGLQPRDRTELLMTDELWERAKKLDPSRLTAGENVNQGAPVVRNDGVVLNGNGRVLTIQRAYSHSKDKAAEYKKYLIDNAEKFGLNPEEISQMKNPIMVREVEGNLDQKLTTDIVNSRTGGSSMKQEESAKIDAEKIRDTNITDYIENGNLSELQYNIINDIAPRGDTRRNSFFDSSKLNDVGISTANKALFALAYSDEHLLTKLANGDSDVKEGFKDVLLKSAPHVIRANWTKGKTGYNLGTIISDAANIYVTQKAKSDSKNDRVQEWLSDNSVPAMFDPIQKAKIDIVDFIHNNINKRANRKTGEEDGRTQVREFLRKIANAVYTQHQTEEESIFDVEEFNQRVDEIVAQQKDKYGAKSLFRLTGDVKDTAITDDMIVAEKDLTPQQKKFTEWADSLDMILNYFKGEKGFEGVNEGNISKLNVNNRDLEQTFWHETTHYLANNNPEMFAEILKEGKITENERRLMRQKSPMYEKLSNDELDEEVLAENFMDIAKRAGLLQKIGRQNKNLAERFISWLKSLMDKFTSFFNNPQGGLTRTQRNAMYNAFKRNIDSMVDADGRRIFRMSRETFEIQRANGEKLPAVPLKQRREIKARYSINPDNNSNEDGKLAKLSDWASTLSDWIRIAWKGKPKEKRWRNEVTKLIQRATGYTIAYRHFDGDETVMIDTVAKLITVDGAYKFDEFMPKASKIIAKKVGLPQTDRMTNYITEWVLRGTPTNSPQEAQLFEKAMAENPKVYGQLRQAQEIFQDVAHMSALDKYGSIIAYEKPNPETQSLKEKFKENFVDDTAPLGKLTDEIRKKYGDNVADALDSQFAVRMYRGGGGIIELMQGAENARQVKDIRELLKLEMPFVNFDNFTPIEQILKLAGGREKMRKFDGYLVALQEKEFHEKNRQAGEKIYETVWDEKNCDDAIKEGKAEFDAAQQAYLNYTNTLLDIAYDSGLISKNQYWAIKTSWKNYATTARVFDDATEIGFDSFMPKKGSSRDVFTPITALINNTEKIVKAAQKNRIKNHLAQLARCEGFGKYISEVEARNGNEPTITYKENGKNKHLATTPEVKRVIDSLDGNSTQANFVTRAIQTASAWVSNVRTTLSLDFSFANPVRDTQEAYLYGENHAKTFGGILKHHALNNPIVNLARAIKMGFEVWNKSALYLEWKAMGGSQATFVSPDMNRSQIMIDDLTKSRYEKFFESGVGGFLEQCLTSMQKFSEFTEEMTRLAVYKSAKDALANQRGGKATYGDMKKAAFTSRNATIDFARGGSSMKKINKYFRFANVGVQDMDKSWTISKNLNPLNLATHEGRLKFFDTSLRLFFGVVLPTIAFWAINHDEDWYKHSTQQWQKDTSWIIGEDFKIPKSLSLFGKVASMITEEALNENPTSAKRIAQPFLESLPSLLPTLLIPITEALTGYSFFYGGALVPQREKNFSAYEQYGKNTSELAKWFGDSALAHGISKAIYGTDDGISPRLFDHILEGYLDFIGKGIEGASNLVGAIKGNRKISFTASEFPILKRFIFDPYKNPQIVIDYYNKRSEQEKAYNVYRKNRRQGKKEIPKNLDLKLYRKIQSVEKAMQNISARERKLLENPNIPADEVKKQLKELEKIRIKLAKKALGRN